MAESERSDKTTVSFYQKDVDNISSYNEMFEQQEQKFNLSEFLRFCLEKKELAVEYLENMKKGIRF